MTNAFTAVLKAFLPFAVIIIKIAAMIASQKKSITRRFAARTTPFVMARVRSIPA